MNAVDKISKKLNNKQHTTTVFLDMRSIVYDMICLFYKLHKLNISIEIIKIIESRLYLTLPHRSFMVKIEEQLSSGHKIIERVLQDSCLSPTLLYLFYSIICRLRTSDFWPMIYYSNQKITIKITYRH